MFRKRGKLTLRYIVPFEILDQIGLLACRLRSPQEFNNIHEVFHVSNIKKFLFDDTLVIPLDKIKTNPMQNFVEEPIEIMDKEDK